MSRYGADSEFRRANPAGWEKRAAAGQDPPDRAGAPLPRQRAEEQGQRRLPGGGALVPRLHRLVPERPARRRRTTSCSPSCCTRTSASPKPPSSTRRSPTSYPNHAKSADAGYAALLGYAEPGEARRAGRAAGAAAHRRRQRAALREGLPAATRAPAPVLTNAAEKLFALHDGERPPSVAQQVLELDPPAAPAQRRVAWTVVAHTAFEKGRFDQAEKAYGEVLALTPDKRPGAQRARRAPGRVDLQAGRAGARRRRARRRPSATSRAWPRWRRTSAVRATAQYDAAAALIGLKDWDGATRTLEDFRQRFPNHPLQADVGSKLAVAYLEKQQWAQAAGEFERVAATQKDPQARPRGAVAGRRAAREGGRRQERLARHRREGLRALPEAVPAAAGARPRGALAPGAHRQGRRRRQARAGADEGDLPGRPAPAAAPAPTAPATSARPRRWRWPSRWWPSTARSRWSSRWRAT